MRPKVLIIDDEEGIREILTDILKARDFDVTSAGTGEQGLKEVSQAHFNVVILDIRLPDMTGIQILEKIEQISPDTQVILVTAYASVDTAVEAVRKKAYDYIAKPFKIEKLVASIEAALERQLLTAENKRMLSQLKFLNAISDKMISTLDLDAILRDTLNLTLDFFSVSAGAIYVRNGNDWTLRERRGVSERFLQNFSRLGNDHPIVREALNFHSARSEGVKGDVGLGASWAAVPLLYKDQALGIMILAGKKPYSLGDEDRRVLAILGAQAGSAIYNALIYDKAEQTRRYLEGLIDNAAEPIASYDLKGTLKTWNPAAAQLYGFGPEDAVGHVMVNTPPERMEETLALFQRVKKGETIIDFETVRMKKDGARIPVTVTYSPIKDSSGAIVGISAMAKDLTLKKQMEEERIRTKVLETRGRIREVLMDVVPLLLRRRLPEEDRNEFISILSMRLEDALYDDYLGGEESIGAETLGNSISQVLNDMGGCFTAEGNGDEIVIVGSKCPWENESKRNPVTCMLTKSISSRFAKRAWGKVKVSLNETLANRDDACIIVIKRYNEDAVSAK
ncbi:MAG: response regulator [Methanomassiliicoccales archaeon]|nr:response regulator [Methanomassiliicoccales archaeon]